MSRTYRKKTRWFIRYEGKDYIWAAERTAKGKFRWYEDWRTVFYVWGADYYDKVIVMGDGKSKAPKGIKKMCRRIDRARYKQDLINNNDAHIRSSWDFGDYEW